MDLDPTAFASAGLKPGLPPQSLILKPDSYVNRMSLAGVFPVDQPLELELGSGDGGFLAAWSACNPNRNFLGVERLLGRLRKLDKKGRRLGLNNLRLMRIEASYFLRYLVPDACVSCLHIYFPDPWPKRKHRGNRLINADFLDTVRRVLVSEGMIYLRTDDLDYFEQMTEVFGAEKSFHPAATPELLAGVLTEFEQLFQAKGIATRHAAYKLLG